MTTKYMLMAHTIRIATPPPILNTLQEDQDIEEPERHRNRKTESLRHQTDLPSVCKFTHERRQAGESQDGDEGKGQLEEKVSVYLDL